MHCLHSGLVISSTSPMMHLARSKGMLLEPAICWLHFMMLGRHPGMVMQLFLPMALYWSFDAFLQSSFWPSALSLAHPSISPSFLFSPMHCASSTPHLALNRTSAQPSFL